MSKHDYVEPFYMVQLSDGDLQEMQTYVSKLKDRDYHHREIIHNNPIHSQGTDVYRTCEIHYPNKNSILNQIGKKIFLDVNEKHYEYDLKDIFEFQLIKYYIGGNYNWHCDYGEAPVRGSVRKLSMSVHLTDPFEYPLAPPPPESAPEAAFPPPAPAPPPPTNNPFAPIT